MKLDLIYDVLTKVYREEEYPALAEQICQWRGSHPLAGRKIFDATPVFRNTMMKYAALLEAGAELTVGFGRGIPYDAGIVEFLKKCEVRIADASALRDCYDVVLDCAGANTDVKAKYGYVELTRSGLERYRNCAQPVFLADNGHIKEIETSLGTGDGFRRGMIHFGFEDFSGKKIVLFGFGKVGRGIVMYARRAGAEVVVVDDIQKVTVPSGMEAVNLKNRSEIESAVQSAWCVVCATGVRNALCGKMDSKVLVNSPAILVNMGVEDEFGPDVPEERVLNGKKPLNFVLEEPTLLKYIDPTMALDNDGILEILEGRVVPGLNNPPACLEEKILDTVRRAGAVALELDNLEKMR